jgi:glycerol uptake facilitator protein
MEVITTSFPFWRHFTGEFIGTALLIILGGGVVANVFLAKTKGNNSGWIVITFGWAMAVFIGVYASQHFGGSGHINPAVTIATAIFSDIVPEAGVNHVAELVGTYLLAQFTGAMVGAIIVWLAYKNHFDETEDKALKLAVFSTAPAIRNPVNNLATEAIGTFILLFGALTMSKPTDALGTLNALPLGLLVLGIGLSLGGPTGHAINPARDLGPRIAHAILPIAGKGGSDWSYSWIPVVGPLIGALLAAWIFNLIHV